MIRLTTPDYYDSFSCIAGDCQETCCAGWQVDLDPAAVERYTAASGEIGERLRNAMRKDDAGYYFYADIRCPFLAKDGLCDIYSALGEDALCETCSRYPRFESDFGSRREIGVSVSCPTAAELILRGEGLPKLVTKELDLPVLPNETDPDYYIAMTRTRDHFFSLLESDTPLPELFMQMLLFAGSLQKMFRSHRFTRLDALFSKSYPVSGKALPFDWANALYPLEPYHADWHTRLDALQNQRPDFSTDGFYRRLAAYFLFRHMTNAVFDGDILTPIKLAVFSTCIVAALAPADADFETRMQCAIDYSREVEHSEENFAALCRTLRESRFSVKAMCAALRLGKKHPK